MGRTQRPASASSRSAAASTPTSPRSCAATPPRPGSTTPSIVNTCAVTAEAVRQATQTIRKLRREEPGRAHHRHGLRRADRAGTLRRHARGRRRRRQRREDAARDLPGPELRRQPARAGQRHHVGARDGARHDRRLRLARPRLRAGAERLRSPLHVLHHPLRPRAVALGAGRRGGGAGAPAGRGRLSGDRADRRRHHRLRRRPAGRHDAGRAGAPHPAARARAQASATFVDRPGRSRCAPDGLPSPRSRA